MMDLKETILKFADDMQENMVACRRDLHAHPEPGWTEFRTAAKVAKTLAEPGYTVKKLVDVRTREGGQHALLGIVEGPDVSGMARWIGSKMALEGLESADQAAAASSTAPLMTAPSQDAIDYLNQTPTCFEAIYDKAPE